MWGLGREPVRRARRARIAVVGLGVAGATLLAAPGVAPAQTGGPGDPPSTATSETDPTATTAPADPGTTTPADPTGTTAPTTPTTAVADPGTTVTTDGSTTSSTAAAPEGTAPAEAGQPPAATPTAPTGPGARLAPAGTTVLLDSGAWSWFEDERAIIDRAGTRLYVSAVANAPERGEVVLGEVDMATGNRRVVDLGTAEMDDHNSAGSWESERGEVLTAWSRHGVDGAIRTHRRRTDGSWLRLPPVTDPSAVTYNNLYSVLAEDGNTVLYDFYRGAGFDPQAMASTDGGRTWSRLGTVIRDAPDSPSARPYVRYASRGDRIDLIATEAHPGQQRTSIYHGFIRDGIVHDSAGRALGRVGAGVAVTELTLIATPGSGRTSWTVDVGYDPGSGNPIAVWSTSMSTADHRYHVGRWDGGAWQNRELAYAGRALYDGQPDYTGLAALDPRDPNRIVISTDANPVTGAPLISATDGRRHWELYEGRRQTNGTYTWTPLTSASTEDNLRPVLTASPSGASALVWMRGRYTTYSNYDLEVVGVVRRANGSLVATRQAGARLPVVPGIARPAGTSVEAVPVPGDYDSHPADDLFLYRPGDGRDDLIIGDELRRPVHAQASTVRRSGYRPVPGDFDADGDTDVLWYTPGTGPEALWITTTATAHADRAVPAVNGDYRPVPGDFDADGDTDILWYAPGTAADVLWTAQGGNFTSRTAPPVTQTYRPVPGDFDADGDTDVLWYAAGERPEALWLAQGGTFTSRAVPAVTQTYEPVAGDFEGDGDTDVLWYRRGTGADILWTAQGASFAGRTAPQVEHDYVPAALDHDGDGGDDVVWYAPGGATDYVWWSGDVPFETSTRAPIAL